MSVRELSSYIFTGKYANDVRELRRRETREEARRRMFDMHRAYYLTGDVPEGCVSSPVREDRVAAVSALIDEAEATFADNLALGSQRVLQYAGTPVLRKHSRGYNCVFSYADRQRFFQEAFWLLLCGSGTGFSVQWHHVSRLPALAPVGGTVVTFTVPDTIEGWADALGALLASYFDVPGDYRGAVVDFDYSLIRPEGSPLSTNTGKAPGPEPLRRSLEAIRGLLDRCLARNALNGHAEFGSPRAYDLHHGGQLQPVDVYDIVMHASDAVLAGGVRRSASICLFSVDDMDMARAKIGNWTRDNPQRGRSNNSALLLRESTTYEQYRRLVELSREWGEPGVVWSDSTEMGVNPCQPAWAPIVTRHGLRTMGDISVGDEIWSQSGWTRVVKKWSTGVKPVFRYRTTAGSFIGTANHRVVSGGVKVEAGEAESIDRLAGPVAEATDLNNSDIVDGLLIGDGTVHRAGGGVFLIAGNDDGDYFTCREIDITQRGYGGNDKYLRVAGATVIDSELPKTYERRIPDRFIHGDSKKARGFLMGLYSANGSIVGDRVTLKTSSPDIRDDVQLMLSAIGIKSYYTTNRPHDVEFENGVYTCRESYDINISDDAGLFARLIGFIQSHKKDRLTRILDKRPGSPKNTFDVVDVEFLGEEEVFDVTVDNDEHTYWTGGLNVSNCVEAGFWPVDEVTGESGWQACNLSLGNMAAVKTMTDARRAARAAAIMGTLQAGYTSFPYLGPVSERITRREALLGVSMTGMAERPDIAFDDASLRELAQVVLDTNAEVASLLDINVAARATCIKPEGCRPMESMTVTSGGVLTLEEMLENHDRDMDWYDDGRFHAPGFGKISKTFRNGHALVSDVTLKNGRRLSSTDNHMWHVIDRGWVRTDELCAGDKITTRPGTYTGSVRKLSDVVYDGAGNGNQDIKFPSAMDERLAYVVGCWFGNGSFSPDKFRIRFVHGDSEIAERYVSEMKAIFDIDINISTDSIGRHYCDFGSRWLWSWIRDNGLMKIGGSRGVVGVPRTVRESRAQDILAFVAGYADCDGCFHANSFCIDSASESMMRSVQVVGEAVGLVFGISHNTGGSSFQGRKDMWKVHMSRGRSLKSAINAVNAYSVKAGRRPVVAGDVSKSGAYHATVVSVARRPVPVETADFEVEGEHAFVEGCLVSHNTSTGMLGAIGSGVHDVHAPRTIRHVQANRHEVQAQYFARHNPHAVEASVWKERDLILSFALQAPPHAAFKADTGALDMLRRVVLVKGAWVDTGRRTECCTRPWISHNVSNTVVVGDGEWDSVTEFIYEHRQSFAGVSLLSEGGDLDYAQAPFVEVRDPHEILATYGRWEPGDYELVDEALGGFRDLWDALDPVTEPVNELQASIRGAWTARFQALVDSDFDGDVRRAGHYLKSLHYWRRWQELTTKTVAVDYSQMIEEQSGVDFGQIVACAGGACQVL